MNKTIIYTSKAPAPIGPYSQAVKVGEMLYVSGQIPIDSSTNSLVEGDISLQTRQVMKNIAAILEEAETTFANVIKCSIFVKDMDDFSAVNEIYGEFFRQDPPARETVEVARLPKNVGVEISCIAFI